MEPPLPRPIFVMQGKTRNKYTTREKLQVVKSLQASGKMKESIAAFYPDLAPKCYESRRKLVLEWQKKETVEKRCKTTRGADSYKDRQLGVGTALPLEAEQELVQWINELREEGVPISATLLRLQALSAADAYAISDLEASWIWLDHFKARHRRSMRACTHQGQKTPAELDSIAASFAQEVLQTLQDLGVSNVYNTDQTAAFFEFIPTKTNNKQGVKTVWVECGGKSKEHATVMLLGDSNRAKYQPLWCSKPTRRRCQVLAKRTIDCAMGLVFEYGEK